MVQVVVLDTNVLLLPFTDRTDVATELERLLGSCDIVIPSSVMQELSGLATQGGKTGQAARGARALSRRYRVEATSLPGDDGLLDVARRLDGIVATNDRKVQQEARRSSLRVAASVRHGRMHLMDE